MPTSQHSSCNTGHDTCDAALASSSEIAHAPPNAPSTQLTPSPLGGADKPAQDLDHLIHEIDEVFGFNTYQHTSRRNQR